MTHARCIRAMNQRSQGVALITALLVIALATAAAVAMAARQQLDIRRTANALQRDQAYVYAVGAEVMAGAVLAKDDLKVDDWDEDWALQKPAIPFEGGILAGSIEDLQGRFNLNNLVNNGQRSDFDFERFKRLLQVLKEKSDPPEVWEKAEPADLANAAVDWIDSDSNVSPGGAEDTDYLQGERPYRVANAPLTSTSELLLVRGFTAPIYNQVAPYVTAVPVRTKLNVNTAKVEVLRAFAEDPHAFDPAKLDRPDPAAAVDDKDGVGGTAKKVVFSSVADFWKNNEIAGVAFVGIPKQNVPAAAPATPAPTPAPSPAPAPTSGTPAAPAKTVLGPDDIFAVTSSYFQVNAYSEVGPDDHRVHVKVYSKLVRSNGKLTTISRMQGFE